MEKLKYLLQEWFERKLPDLIERDFPLEKLEADLILSVAGVRRGGKTYLLYQIARKLKEKVPGENIFYVNFEDDRLFPIEGGELRELLGVIEENFNWDSKYPLFLLLDEIQNIPQWDKTLRRFYDSGYNLKIIVTGSTADLLPDRISSALRGRTLTHIVYPFSFKEFLRAKGVEFDKKLDYSPRRHRIIRLFQEYLEYGGFPQVVLTESKELKLEILKEYYKTIFYRDIFEKASFKNLWLFENFLKIVVEHMASLFSYGKVEKFFRSIGIKTSRKTLGEYMKAIESAFFAWEVPIFSYNIQDRLQYPRKIYLVDTGLRNAVTFRFSRDWGRLAENAVFLELRRRGKEVYYWKNPQGYEVDFVIKEGIYVKELLQVCWEGKDETTLAREKRALVKAMEEFSLPEGIVLTRDYSWQEKINGKRITLIPIWKWMLSQK